MIFSRDGQEENCASTKQKQHKKLSNKYNQGFTQDGAAWESDLQGWRIRPDDPDYTTKRDDY